MDVVDVVYVVAVDVVAGELVELQQDAGDGEVGEEDCPVQLVDEQGGVGSVV